MNSRIYDFLEMFSILDLVLAWPDQFEQIQNSDLNIQLDKWQQIVSFSKDFLIKNIERD